MTYNVFSGTLNPTHFTRLPVHRLLSENCISASVIVGWLEFNVPFQHKYGYIRDDICYSCWSLHMEWSDRQRTRFYATCVTIHTLVFAVLSNPVINVWNSLLMSTDFARFASFKMSLRYVGLPDYMIGE